MIRLSLLCLFLLTTACAPLQPHESAWGDAGEVAWRTPIALATLGWSELVIKESRERAAKQEAYWRWYAGLSVEERDREDRREAARLNALGMALMGGGPFRNSAVYAAPVTPRTAPVLLPPSTRTCTAIPAGTLTYVDCY